MGKLIKELALARLEIRRECFEFFKNHMTLTPDHIHVYVESDGELSVEEMVHRIKRFSNNAISEEFPLVMEKFGADFGIWDEAYFVEKIG